MKDSHNTFIAAYTLVHQFRNLVPRQVCMLHWFVHNVACGLTSSLLPCSCRRLHGQALADPSSEKGWRIQARTWCKGVMSASQAEALQLKCECVHFFGLSPWPWSAYTQRSASAFEWAALKFIAEFGRVLRILSAPPRVSSGKL
jgi:hypothetical protein